MVATVTRYTRTVYGQQGPKVQRLPFRAGQVNTHIHRHNGQAAKAHACCTVPLVQAQQIIAMWNADLERVGQCNTRYSL